MAAISGTLTPVCWGSTNGPARRGGRPLCAFAWAQVPDRVRVLHEDQTPFPQPIPPLAGVRNKYRTIISLQCLKPVAKIPDSENLARVEENAGLSRFGQFGAVVQKAVTLFLIFLASLLALEVMKGFMFAPQAWAAVAAVPPQDTGVMAFAMKGLSVLLHLDKYLGQVIVRYGTATYAILFGIVFAETGLVVTPFLPGDSLLFATGALAALGKLDIRLLLAVYVSAAVLGDAVNYAIGNYFGAKALQSKLIKKEYIDKTEEFYKKYGGKTVVLARFIPIIRTFAPFIAGIGSMAYGKFGMYNVLGALLWTGVCTGAGYAFGNVPAVHNNFSLVVLGIIVVSVLPVAYELIVSKAEK